MVATNNTSSAQRTMGSESRRSKLTCRDHTVYLKGAQGENKCPDSEETEIALLGARRVPLGHGAWQSHSRASATRTFEKVERGPISLTFISRERIYP